MGPGCLCCVLYNKDKRHKAGQLRQRNKHGKCTGKWQEEECKGLGGNPAGGKDIGLLLVMCVCQVEVSATDRSIQRSPTDCGVSLCVVLKRQEWGSPGPHWTVAPEENITLLTFSSFEKSSVLTRTMISCKQKMVCCWLFCLCSWQACITIRRSYRM
jgi:hypothetical protein